MDGVQKLSQKDNESWEIGFSRGLPFADLTTPTGEFSMRNGTYYNSYLLIFHINIHYKCILVIIIK